jgi:peptidoglycan/xylan/chitin deacetylase (PgdA/CDA1 family)
MFRLITVILIIIILVFTSLSVIKISNERNNNPTLSKLPELSSPMPSQSPDKTILPKTSPNILPTTPKPTTTPPSSLKTTAPAQSYTEISWGNRNKNQVIFTFDAGAGNHSLEKILDALKKYNIKSTFFVTGSWVEKNTENTKKISLEGHEIFNHTFTHPYLTKITDEEIKNELNRTEQLIYDLTGKTTKPYFRPPYGDRDQRVLNAASSAGYRSVYWTVDALDWKENESFTADQVKTRIYNNLQPGTIYLMHIGDNITGNILEEVFLYIQSKGYKIVSLSEGTV